MGNRWEVRTGYKKKHTVGQLRDLMTHRFQAYMDAIGGETTNPAVIRKRADKYAEAHAAYHRARKRHRDG